MLNQTACEQHMQMCHPKPYASAHPERSAAKSKDAQDKLHETSLQEILCEACPACASAAGTGEPVEGLRMTPCYVAS